MNVSSVGWCCLVSSSFRWCCCYLFSFCVVLPSFLSFGCGCFFPFPPLGGAPFLLPFGWCCCFFFSFRWCCLPRPPLEEKGRRKSTRKKKERLQRNTSRKTKKNIRKPNPGTYWSHSTLQTSGLFTLELLHAFPNHVKVLRDHFPSHLTSKNAELLSFETIPWPPPLRVFKVKNIVFGTLLFHLLSFQLYRAGQNDYRYRSEIKSKTIGLYQITDVTDLY